MLARRFLGCITFIVLLAVAGAFLFFQFGDRLLTKAVTPEGHFVAPAASDGPDYVAIGSWLSRPSDGTSLAEWRPDQADGTPAPPPTLQPKAAATFFIHPTTYLETDRWNAPLEPGGETEKRSQLFVRSQASVFNEVSTVWAPRYRQAAFGAFLLRSEDAQQALDLAYGDVSRAFDAFLAANPTGPLILAGHSQGSLHLLRLLVDKKAALRGRVVAAYVGGWPVGVTADLPATGLPACRAAGDTGCVLSWQTFSTPANPALVLNSWVGTKGLAGPDRTRADMLCVDPVSGTLNGSSAAGAHPGMLVPNADFTKATLAPGRLATKCDEGFLTVEGELPNLGNFALPGNNLHPYDYALFWSALRADVARRLAAFGPR